MTALWYALTREGPIGGSSQVKITLQPAEGNQLRVGIFESEVGGAGGQWRASGWMAAVIATLLTADSLKGQQFSIQTDGRIDGPSAGALMTIGMLAALRGKTVRDDAAMTGTINPDGTIGPVGGIPQKIEGAAEAGKKLVLVPSGQRMEVDARSGARVDVIAWGRERGVEVREVADIYAAYEILTGDLLPRSGETRRPELDEQLFNQMQNKTNEWTQRLVEEVNRYRNAPDELKFDFVQALITDAVSQSERADNLLRQGLVASAYSAAFEAAVLATIANETLTALQAYGLKGFDGAVDFLKGNQQTIEGRSAILLNRLQTLQPKTLSDVAVLASAYGTALESAGLASIASDLLQTSVETEEQALEVIFTAALYYKLAALNLENARDAVDVLFGTEGAPIPADMPLNDVADFLRRAAEANLNLFEASVIDSYAEELNIRTERLKEILLSRDLSYGLAFTSISLLPSFTRNLKGDAAAYATLGGALNAYRGATGLIAKYYSLDAALDNSFNVTGIGREKALLDMLDLADEQARRGISLLQQNNVDAGLPILLYESARLGREGDASSKMGALEQYWNAYTLSRVLALLGGFN